MTIGEALLEGTKLLNQARIETARLDCLIMIEDILGKDRAILLAHPETTFPDSKYQAFRDRLSKRKEHIPLAYIRKKAMFYGRSFAVTHDVLVPRPETEAAIDITKKLATMPNAQVADIGTGSGCLGITAALELRGSSVDLYDIDESALDVAKHNAKDLGVDNRITYHINDLFRGVNRKYDIVLANLPYVPDNYPINEAAQHEPKIALFAGSDGLDAYRRFWQQIAVSSLKPKHVICESLPQQHSALSQLALSAGYKLAQTEDLVQAFLLA